ncbi:nitronate monooxygenase [Brevibacterium luteolum]|uniref:Propionate 3-nitronate monooxygenase n=1 Tax=Brevibacterium luteolum TaxID=199591 RepID=A0A6G8KYC0_9MICO|nr:nitronate monooxygenase [Brevibacterium luteolum]QIN29808.1 nitronate monooxygenase [Brevibacterium luteolum]
MTTPDAARPAVTELLSTDRPLVGAPMAGGATTPRLAAAIAAGGGFPFLAGGYLTAAVLRTQIDAFRQLAGDVAFGVNLFVPQQAPVDEAAFSAYAGRLAPLADELDAPIDARPVMDDDHFEEKLQALLADPVPVVSLTFGLPAPEAVARLHAVGTCVLATVTNTSEAEAAAGIGCDGLIVQGSRAGGHAGTHDPLRAVPEVETADVVREVRERVDLPVIAAGGVDGPEAVTALLEAGALAVQVGTLLLRTHEAGTSAVHRQALADPRFTQTALTRAFTGRLARSLRNRFIDDYAAAAPAAYPQVHHLTKPIRTAAAKAGQPDWVHLWAGTGWQSAREEPAAETLARLTPPR